MLLIPDSSSMMFVRHLKDLKTFSGSSPLNEYKYVLRTLVQCSKKAGKSLDEVKHDLESETAVSSKKEMKVASDEAKNKSSPHSLHRMWWRVYMTVCGVDEVKLCS